MDSLYREAIVMKDGELCPCTIQRFVMESGFIWGRRAIMHGILQSNHHFYTVLDYYNPETSTFFTPVVEMGSPCMSVENLKAGDGGCSL